MTFPILPFLQLISSKVPKAEYVPNIIRRDDPSIIPILYVSSSHQDFNILKMRFQPGVIVAPDKIVVAYTVTI